MKTLFQSVEDLRTYVNVDISQEFSTILPSLLQAHIYLRNLIGNIELNALIESYNSDSISEKYAALLPFCQNALAQFAYASALPKLAVVVGETGIGVVSNDRMVPANKEKIDALINSLTADGYNALEEIIVFVKANKDVYTDAYHTIFRMNLFINNVDEFNTAIATNLRNIEFVEIVKFITFIERRNIAPVLGDNYAVLKIAITNGELTEAQADLLNNYIRPALCYITYDMKYINENFRNEGMRLIDRLSIKINPDTKSFIYENKAGSGFYFAGA